MNSVLFDPHVFRSLKEYIVHHETNFNLPAFISYNQLVDFLFLSDMLHELCVGTPLADGMGFTQPFSENFLLFRADFTVTCVYIIQEYTEWMSHRKQRETKQQPSMLPGPAVPGCCLVSSHFLCDIHYIHSVG